MEVGDRVNAAVVGVHAYGIDVEVGGIPGFIQPIEVSWNESIEPKDVVEVGSVVEVLVTALSPDRFSASIKQLYPEKDPWRNIAQIGVGAPLDGTVIGDLGWGYAVDVGGGITGVLADNQVPRRFSVHDSVRVTVAGIDMARRKVTLSESVSRER
ncbi:MAG: S1 RNA-binding domain-containing protein [Myxococcota bacterium]